MNLLSNPRRILSVLALVMMATGSASEFYRGQPYFVLTDVEHNQVYVGQHTQDEEYKRRSIVQHMSDGNLEAAEAPQLAALNFIDQQSCRLASSQFGFPEFFKNQGQTIPIRPRQFKSIQT